MGAERVLHHLAELERAHRAPPPLSGPELVAQYVRQMVETQCAPDKVPDHGAPEFLACMLEDLHKKRDEAAAAAREATAAQRELGAAAPQDAAPGGAEDAPTDFSLVIAGVGHVCKMFDFLVAAAGVRFGDGRVALASAIPELTDTPASALRLPLHVVAQDAHFKVRPRPGCGSRSAARAGQQRNARLPHLTRACGRAAHRARVPGHAARVFRGDGAHVDHQRTALGGRAGGRIHRRGR